MIGRLALGLLGPAAVAAAQSSAPSLAIEPYTLRTFDGGERQIEIGRIVVPESRARPGAPSITVGFYRLKSTAATPGSPIVFLMGGPGIAASLLAPVPPFWVLFDRLTASGDVILLDQRGLGLSTPRLDCPPAAEPVSTDFLATAASFVASYGKIVAQCAAHWRGKGVDPRAYSDESVAQDVDDIRAALGAPRVSLLGFSYGTKLAMTYARRFPGRLDRIVLQGSADGDLLYRSALRYDTLLSRVGRRAESDTVVGAFSKDLVARMGALLGRAARLPLVARIRTGTGDSLNIPVSRTGLAGLITGRIADPRIPALVATLEAGDMIILSRWVESIYNDFSAGAGSLMARALSCSSPPSAARRARVDAEAGRSLFGPTLDNLVQIDPFCSSLGGSPPAAVPRAAGPIPRPALFITGENDDRTPPSNAEALSAEFVRPVRLVVENGGHELLVSPRVADAVVTFLGGGDVSGVVLKERPARFLSLEAARLPPPRRPGQ